MAGNANPPPFNSLNPLNSWEHGESALTDLRTAFGIPLNGTLGLARLGGCVGGEAIGIIAFTCVANLATYARRAMLRLRVQRLTGVFSVRCGNTYVIQRLALDFARKNSSCQGPSEEHSLSQSYRTRLGFRVH